MPFTSANRRVYARALAGTVTEFDSLARALSARLESTSDPRWVLRQVDGRLEHTGKIADIDGIELKRIRALELEIGRHSDDRQLKLGVDWAGVRVEPDPLWD